MCFQFYSDNKRYPDDLDDLGHTPVDGKYLSNDIAGTEGDESYYHLYINSTTTTYTLSAEPFYEDQKKDKRCKTFQLTHRGEKTVTAGTWKSTGQCW